MLLIILYIAIVFGLLASVFTLTAVARSGQLTQINSIDSEEA